MKKLFLALSALVIVFLSVLIIKTVLFTSLQPKIEAITLPVINTISAGNLSKAIAFQTVSVAVDTPADTVAFTGLHRFVAAAYPLIASKLKKETVSTLSLLYTWQGKSAALKPVILTAHMDVVGVEEPDLWTRPPFSGENDGTYIWGRGTLDDKGEMIMILEAVEKLLAEGYQPERTIYLAFGHDEEISGGSGAVAIASILKQRGVQAEYLLDEGAAVTLGIVPMISRPVALVGTSEKGKLSVRLTVELPGGHSAYPKKESAITVMTKALNHITDNQMKAHIATPVNDFMRYIGPEMPFYSRVIFANRWLFEDVILKIYQMGTTSSALVRTTTAPTIVHSGLKDNVVPSRAEAVVNFRILPGETSADVTQHLKKVIDDDRLKISILKGNNEPRPVSPVHGFGFSCIVKTIGQVYPDAVLAPTMLVVGTDSREYAGICTNIYNFAPIVVNAEDIARMHGLDERIKIEDFNKGIVFYYQLLKNSNL